MNRLLCFLLVLCSAQPLAAQPLTIPLPAPQRVMNSYNWDEYTYESVRFSPSGQEVAVASDDGLLWLFDTNTGQKRWQTSLGNNVRLRGLAFAPDGQTLYTGEQSLEVQIQAVNVRDGQVRWRYRAKEDLKGEVGQGTFAGVNRDLAVDRTGNLYLMTYWTVFGGAQPVARTQVVSLDPRGHVRWRYPKTPFETTVGGGVSVSPDGRWVAAVTGDFVRDYAKDKSRGLTTLLLDSSTGTLVQSRLLPPVARTIAPVCPPAFSPDSKSLMTLGGNGQAVLYALGKTGATLTPLWQKQFSQPKGPVTVYYKFLLAPALERWLVMAGTTAPLPGAQDEDPKTEHPDSNTVFLLDQTGNVRNRWHVASLDRPPIWLAQTLALPIAQNTVGVQKPGLALISLKTGKLAQPVSTQGAIIAVDVTPKHYAALEVPLHLPEGNTIGQHRLYLGATITPDNLKTNKH
ncbi:WD40 repeat domain-containing protein [Anthocerotibacter panamensis]|uniref:WD40 repeat domain-containing protein n=1 Tax=Anthocerotibacter panamensis TaxID=2857077 RepID=UPI001C405E3A|nr:PQQ-binding-like beta-propeller repeat protein [Anthocerotibacter panamensis]